MARILIKNLIVAVVFIAASTAAIQAQFYFGKNKVQYTRFDWKVMTTDHFRIYFYKEEVDVARMAADIAEKAYRTMAIRFNQEIRHKIPLIIYSAPSYFSQTNVVPGLLPESVGGFTEFLKGRVVVPYFGSYFDFVHVITHEMVHVFQTAKLESVTDRQSALRYGYPPLWFIEGQAEYWSQGWDTEADMILKDMVLGGRLLDIDELYQVQGTYFMYKLGESICAFIDSTYGPGKLTQIYDNWPKGTSFEQVVEITLGDNIQEVSRKWHYAMKRKYFPEIQALGLPKMESQLVSADGYAVKGVPIHWDDGRGARDWIVFKANRLGYTGIYMRLAGDKRAPVKTLLKGERSAKFESLHLLRSGIDANDSGFVIFSSQSKERDVIYLYDLKKDKVVREYTFDDLIAARSPRFSPDGKKVVFSGVTEAGFSDVYILDLASGDYSYITHDVFDDVDPTFTPDGSQVIFASERGPDGEKGASNLFSIDLATKKITQLTFGLYKDQAPEATKQGIYFNSDRQGVFNLYLLSPDGSMTRQSTYVTGAFDPRLSSDGTRLVYTGYQDEMFSVYEMTLLKQPESIMQAATHDTVSWTPREIDRKYADASITYDAHYSFDIAQSSIAYDPIFGSVGGIQAAMSDMLGNRAFYFLLANTATSREQFLSSFNAGVTYVNRTRRLNWGAGLYHLYDEYYNDYDGYYFERQAGGVALFSYPLSKFHRVDMGVYARYDKKDLEFGLGGREAFLVSDYISWVYDNSIWDLSGPLEGRRYNLTVGGTYSINNGRVFNRLGFADIRHYFRLGRYSAFANRLFAYSSAGLEPQRIYLGGSWSFRGFDRRAFYNRNVLFASSELRFPLIDALIIGLPIGALGFEGIRGALFYDNGAAWDDKFDRFYGSFGAGFRVNLFYVVLLRFDFSRVTDYRTISPNTHFDFFFGWNF